MVPALLTGLTIAAYSLADGVGVRVSGNALADIALLFAAKAIVSGFILFHQDESAACSAPCVRSGLGLSAAASPAPPMHWRSCQSPSVFLGAVSTDP